MSQREGSGVRCSNPIDAAVLADYWLGALQASEEERVEEHFFACDACGERLLEMIALAEGVRSLAREGTLRMVVSDLFLDRAVHEGLRVRQYAPPAGGSVECTVTAEDDILIARLAADLRGARRIDLSMCNERGIEQYRLRDIPIHSGASVVYQESITVAKALPTTKMIARLISFDETGTETVVGEYAFNHTRSLPGPGEFVI